MSDLDPLSEGPQDHPTTLEKHVPRHRGFLLLESRINPLPAPSHDRELSESGKPRALAVPSPPLSRCPSTAALAEAGWVPAAVTSSANVYLLAIIKKKEGFGLQAL